MSEVSTIIRSGNIESELVANGRSLSLTINKETFDKMEQAEGCLNSNFLNHWFDYAPIPGNDDLISISTQLDNNESTIADYKASVFGPSLKSFKDEMLPVLKAFLSFAYYLELGKEWDTDMNPLNLIYVDNIDEPGIIKAFFHDSKPIHTIDQNEFFASVKEMMFYIFTPEEENTADAYPDLTAQDYFNQLADNPDLVSRFNADDIQDLSDFVFELQNDMDGFPIKSVKDVFIALGDSKTPIEIEKDKGIVQPSNDPENLADYMGSRTEDDPQYQQAQAQKKAAEAEANLTPKEKKQKQLEELKAEQEEKKAEKQRQKELKKKEKEKAQQEKQQQLEKQREQAQAEKQKREQEKQQREQEKKEKAEKARRTKQHEAEERAIRDKSKLDRARLDAQKTAQAERDKKQADEAAAAQAGKDESFLEPINQNDSKIRNQGTSGSGSKKKVIIASAIAGILLLGGGFALVHHNSSNQSQGPKLTESSTNPNSSSAFRNGSTAEAAQNHKSAAANFDKFFSAGGNLSSLNNNQIGAVFSAYLNTSQYQKILDNIGNQQTATALVNFLTAKKNLKATNDLKSTQPIIILAKADANKDYAEIVSQSGKVDVSQNGVLQLDICKAFAKTKKLKEGKSWAKDQSQTKKLIQAIKAYAQQDGMSEKEISSQLD